MNIFITGSTGFIGKYLTNALVDSCDNLLLLSRQAYNIRSLQLAPNVIVIEGGLSDINSWQSKVNEFSPDVAVHLAWEGIPDFSFEMSVKNLRYGLDLLGMLAKVGCKTVICAGSCWEYGEQSGEVTEEAEVIPYNAFTAAKNSLHWMVREITKENDMRFFWTRLFYVYGPGQRETSLLPYIIRQVQQGKNPELKTPSISNDFIYVEDVVRAFVAIIKNQPENSVYNIGSGSETSVKSIAEMVCKQYAVPREINMSGGTDGNQTISLLADISKIKRDTGWEPKISIEEGIQRMIDSYQGEKIDE
ncbi:NAD-dependent epimerase/dehydratase family protein [Chloroflexota bacterium]